MPRTVDYIIIASLRGQYRQMELIQQPITQHTYAMKQKEKKKKNPNLNMQDALACHGFVASPLGEGDQELPKRQWSP